MKKNIEDYCPLCGGTKKRGETIFTADTGNGLVVIRNVPASICVQCGESWIDAKSAKIVEGIARRARATGTQVEVVAL